MSTLVRMNSYVRNHAEEIISNIAIVSFLASVVVLFTVLSM